MAYLRITTTLFVLASLISGSADALSSKVAANIVISEATPEEHAMAEWALSRYELAGLALPPLIIEFADRNQAACDGAPARSYLYATPVVRICWNDRFIILHELAHVWEARNVSTANREAFMSVRTGILSWASTEVPWSDRGVEHAANVVAWGLLATPYPISRTYPNDKQSLRKAFEFLTGVEPLHDGGPDIPLPAYHTVPGRTTPHLESGR